MIYESDPKKSALVRPTVAAAIVGNQELVVKFNSQQFKFYDWRERKKKERTKPTSGVLLTFYQTNFPAQETRLGHEIMKSSIDYDTHFTLIASQM